MNNFRPNGKQSKKGLTPELIAAIYAVVGWSWIIASDLILDMVSNDPEVITRIQTYKGSFYIIVTAVMLYWLIRRYGDKFLLAEEALEKARDNLEKTVMDLTRKEEELLQVNEGLKQMEDKLAKSEYKLGTIIATDPDCIKLLALDCTIMEINPAGLAMIEADSLSEIVGKSLLPMIVPAYRRPFQKLAEKVFKGGSGMLEFEIIGLKGTRRWLETRALPLRDAKGEITAILEITRDVTERKKTDTEIKERVEELEKFYEMSVGRELKMKELKEEIAQLKADLSGYKKE
ncbi:MAG: PAS domain S-box protein [Nitrospirae bacterium]|nr:MAG: PAS domain S-box protein [Nitrospirota bacterium]